MGIGKLCDGNSIHDGSGVFLGSGRNTLYREFTSNDEIVKTTLLGLAGFSEIALYQMEEVHMLLDREDPSVVNFTAVMDDAGMIHYDDLDRTLRFGEAKSDPRIESWLKTPSYPPTPTEPRRTWKPIARICLIWVIRQ